MASNQSCLTNLFPIHLLLLRLLVVVLCIDSALSWSHIVETLPGFTGDLPFKLETGYVSARDSDEVQLFYYFIESEGNPREDPLMLWLTGGPGCSAFSGLVYEIGPLQFDTQPKHNDPKFPKLTLNQYSWTKVASIIFLDAPVGTGFSYANNWESYVVDDHLSATDAYNFLIKWLMDHPKFLSNDLYIAGDSYSGIIVPMIVKRIYYGNSEVGIQPLIQLKGYVLGNPLTSQHDDVNSRVDFVHGMAILTDGLYESTKSNCHGEYVDVDPNNAACIKDLTLVTRGYNYLLSYAWANNACVQHALHIRKGTIEKWVRCNKSLSYTEDVLTSLDYHRNLTHTDLRVLIYRYTTDYVNSGCVYRLTYATIKARKEKKIQLRSGSHGSRVQAKRKSCHGKEVACYIPYLIDTTTLKCHFPNKLLLESLFSAGWDPVMGLSYVKENGAH